MFEDFLAGLEHIRDLFLDARLIELIVYLYFRGGWLVAFAILFAGAFKLHRIYKVLKFKKRMKWVFLAVDVPKLNEQTPRAVENIFAHLAGAHSTRDLIEKYWIGETQRWFSFEIVSINGYIQFVVGTEKKHRDLVEASIYAQYPDAELTEIEDYCQWAPDHYPHPEYKIWGLEYKPVSHDFTNSIRTWDDFEDKITGTIKDPMAALLETFTRIGQGEQLWMQLLIRPIGQKWVQHGIERINKIMGTEETGHQSILQKAVAAPLKGLESLSRYALTAQFEEEYAEKRQEFKFMNPVEHEIITAISNKVSRIGFHAKIRFIYIARHEVFNKNKVHHALTGSMKQFTDELGNGLKPDTKHTQVTSHYLFEDWRKNHKRTHLMHTFKKRDIWEGFPRFILNIRELATVWHFPMIEVKTPALKRSEVRTSRPPTGLPFESEQTILEPLTATSAASSGDVAPMRVTPDAAHGEGLEPAAVPAMMGKITPHGGGLTEQHGAPPSNLPFVD